MLSSSDCAGNFYTTINIVSIKYSSHKKKCLQFLHPSRQIFAIIQIFICQNEFKPQGIYTKHIDC